MSLTLRAPARAGSVGGSARTSISTFVSVLVVLLVIVGGLSVLATASRPVGPAAPSHVTSAASPPTHGDLVVTSGQTFVIRPPAGSHTYYQGGNITVESGGTLIVLNVTLSFVQFVSDVGTPMQRLSHIDRFVDQGTVNFYNSTLTTDVQVINAWAKLNVTVEGTMSAWNSTFAFPGWVYVVGASADLTLNGSRVMGNPAVLALSEPSTILGDTEFAPSIVVSAGAEFNLFNSSLNATYADNTAANGAPAPAPLGLVTNPYLVPIYTGDNNQTDLYTPNDSANLTQDWLYPNANFQAGYMVLQWNNPSKVAALVGVYVWYDGVRYPIAVGGNALVFANGSYGKLIVPLTASLLANITHYGVLNYLNWTGEFGVTPGRIAFDFDVISGPALVNVSAAMTILPAPDYNMLVSGAGSTLNSVDSSFDLNWNALPASATSQQVPFPWGSNKLYLTDGAVAYMANATVQGGLPGVFVHSAVLPDATSQAYFYRWAVFNVTGKGGFLPIPNTQVVAYYDYNVNQTDNATANNLNKLATANPQIWGYVQYWDQQHGVRAYGLSNQSGVASILLASSEVTTSTLPDGFFLGGGYHIGVTVPAPTISPHWFNWSVSPYPEGVAVLPPNVAGPDYGPTQLFPQYFGGVAIASATVLANGVASTTINLGQVVSVQLNVEDIGTAPVLYLQGALFYDAPGAPSVLLTAYPNTGVDLTAAGQTTVVTIDWTATGNVTGIHPDFTRNLTANLSWNNGSAREAGGNLSQNVTVTFVPTLLAVKSVALLANNLVNSTVDLGQTLGVQVTIVDVGNSTINAVSVALLYNRTGDLAWYNHTGPILDAAGMTDTFTLSWKTTENVTGLHGWFTHDLSLQLSWNNVSNLVWLGNGNLAQNVSVNFAPSQIRFTSFSLPPATVYLNGTYESLAELEYNGSQPAAISLTATPVGGGPSVVIAAGSATPGANFTLPWFTLSSLLPGLTPGTTYTVVATASYNSRETNYTVGTFTVPPTPSSNTNIFLQKFLGLPLWAWLAIAAAAVVGILVFLFVVRRQAAGKLVECGECGNLIPEDATICPKCGAEFETDLIRCSRCASTIPANSKFCPECAAQLLGTPGEAASDPEKQAYADFTEKYRAEGKRELGDNYSEGAFWDWWKRQPTYTPFSQWSLQQGQGTARAGMTAPPIGTEMTTEGQAAAGQTPPKGATGWSEGSPAPPPTTAASPAPPAAPAGAGLKACPNCGKEIPAEYLVCPFCNAVTS